MALLSPAAEETAQRRAFWRHTWGPNPLLAWICSGRDGEQMANLMGTEADVY